MYIDRNEPVDVMVQRIETDFFHANNNKNAKNSQKVKKGCIDSQPATIAQESAPKKSLSKTQKVAKNSDKPLNWDWCLSIHIYHSYLKNYFFNKN